MKPEQFTAHYGLSLTIGNDGPSDRTPGHDLIFVKLELWPLSVLGRWPSGETPNGSLIWCNHYKDYAKRYKNIGDFKTNFQGGFVYKTIQGDYKRYRMVRKELLKLANALPTPRKFMRDLTTVEVTPLP